jgi:hypothetical protein
MTNTLQIDKTPHIREFICNLLCNGMYYFSGYGIQLNYSRKGYELTKESSTLSDPAWEDVLTQMIIDGYTLHFDDIEGDGEMNADLTLQSVEDGLKNLYGVNPTFTNAVDTLLAEEDDAETCDVILQCILYGDIIFG